MCMCVRGRRARHRCARREPFSAAASPTADSNFHGAGPLSIFCLACMCLHLVFYILVLFVRASFLHFTTNNKPSTRQSQMFTMYKVYAAELLYWGGRGYLHELREGGGHRARQQPQRPRRERLAHAPTAVGGVPVPNHALWSPVPLVDGIALRGGSGTSVVDRYGLNKARR